jgi:hypothetical protein
MMLTLTEEARFLSTDLRRGSKEVDDLGDLVVKLAERVDQLTRLVNQLRSKK